MDISSAKCPGCNRPMQIVRTACPDCDIALDGEFEVSGLGRLPLEEQLFVVAFLRHHGSIKKMEVLFGISYPTVKNRLNAIADQLDKTFEPPTTNAAILEKLSRGEVSVEEALDLMD